MTLIVLFVAVVFHAARDSRSAGAIEPLSAKALNVTGQIGTLSLARNVSPLVIALRRSNDEDRSEDTEGITRSAEVDRNERRNGNTVSEGVVTSGNSSGTAIQAEVETEDPTTDGLLEPHLALTHAERMARLEASSPKLTNRVDRLDWARVPVEPPLFRVFEETDADVVPPGTKDIPLRDDLRLVWSSGLRDGEAQLGAWGEPDVGDRVGMVEVTISERGEVEKARLLSVPNSIYGAMLLSVIKAWQFTPATKDGQAVRYRQVMPLIAAR